MKMKLGDLDMTYGDTGGTGVPLVLIHGFPLDASIWADQVSGLAAVARVITPNLRGFGDSAAPRGLMSVGQYADDVAQLLEVLGVAQAVIGGVSMGGYVALAFQRRFAKRARGLLLVDTRAGADSEEAKRGRDKTIALVRAQGAAALADEMLPKMLTPGAPEAMLSALRSVMARQSVDGIIAALGAIRDRPDATPGLEAIQVPTHIIHGHDDTLIPLEQAEVLRSGIAGARLTTIGGAAHLPNIEQASAFNAAIRELLTYVR